MTVAEYLRRKKNLKETTFRVKEDGSKFYVVNGEEIPAKQFEAANTIPISLIDYVKPNADKRNDWLRS